VKLDSDKAVTSSIKENAIKNMGIHKAVFPLIVRLATLAFFRPITQDLSQVRELLNRGSGPNSNISHELSDLIGIVFSQDSDWKQMYDMIAEYYADGRIDLGMIANVGCVMRSSLAQSLAFQIKFAHTIEKLFPKRCSLQKKIIEPFFLVYWKNRATRADMGFRTAPAYAERRIQDVSAAQQGTRLRSLLREMVFCVGLKISDDDRSWLESEQTS